MPSDAERWRFLSDHQLTLHTDGGDYGYLVHWCKTAGPGEPPKFYPVSNGATAEQAVDRANRRVHCVSCSCGEGYCKYSPTHSARLMLASSVKRIAVILVVLLTACESDEAKYTRLNEELLRAQLPVHNYEWAEAHHEPLCP